MPFHWRYRLQNSLFALRRYLPGPLRQALKPVYRRWWESAARRKREFALAAGYPKGTYNNTFRRTGMNR
jgi:hypothetical protein